MIVKNAVFLRCVHRLLSFATLTVEYLASASPVSTPNYGLDVGPKALSALCANLVYRRAALG